LPIFSVVVFGILLYIMTRRCTYLERYTNLFILTCVLKIYWFQGYLFKIGHNEISSIAYLSNHFLVIYSLYLIIAGKININPQILKHTIYFLIVIFLGMMYEKIHPYGGLLLPVQDDVTSWDTYVLGMCEMYPYVPSVSEMARSLFDVGIFSFEVLVFKSIYNYEWFITLYMKVIDWLKYGIYYGYAEWIIKNLVGNLTVTFSFAEIMLGANEFAVFTDARTRDGIFYTVQGLTREPSYFNGFLLTLSLLMLFGNMLKKMANKRNIPFPDTYNKYTLVLCIMLLFFTGGFSAVWFLFVIGSCTILLHIRESGVSIFSFFIKRKKFIASFIISCSIAVIALVQNDYFYNRLIDAFSVVNFLSGNGGYIGISALGSDNSIASTITRFVSIYEGVMIFLDRPLMGLSYKVQSIHDWSLMLTINIGIIGMCFLYKMLISSKEKQRYDFFMLFLIFIIGGLPVNICPSALCIYWVLLFEATTYYMNEIRC